MAKVNRARYVSMSVDEVNAVLKEMNEQEFELTHVIQRMPNPSSNTYGFSVPGMILFFEGSAKVEPVVPTAQAVGYRGDSEPKHIGGGV